MASSLMARSALSFSFFLSWATSLSAPPATSISSWFFLSSFLTFAARWCELFFSSLKSCRSYSSICCRISSLRTFSASASCTWVFWLPLQPNCSYSWPCFRSCCSSISILEFKSDFSCSKTAEIALADRSSSYYLVLSTCYKSSIILLFISFCWAIASAWPFLLCCSRDIRCRFISLSYSSATLVLVTSNIDYKVNISCSNFLILSASL